MNKFIDFINGYEFGGYSSKGSGLEYPKIPAKPVKYIVSAIVGWNPEKGKFAKQMNGLVIRLSL